MWQWKKYLPQYGQKGNNDSTSVLDPSLNVVS